MSAEPVSSESSAESEYKAQIKKGTTSNLPPAAKNNLRATRRSQNASSSNTNGGPKPEPSHSPDPASLEMDVVEDPTMQRRGSSSLSEHSSNSPSPNPPKPTELPKVPSITSKLRGRAKSGASSSAPNSKTPFQEDPASADEAPPSASQPPSKKANGKRRARQSSSESELSDSDVAGPAKVRRGAGGGGAGGGGGDTKSPSDSDSDTVPSRSRSAKTSGARRGRGRPKKKATVVSETSNVGRFGQRPPAVASASKAKASPAPESGTGLRATRATVTLPAGYIEGVKNTRMSKPRSTSVDPVRGASEVAASPAEVVQGKAKKAAKAKELEKEKEREQEKEKNKEKEKEKEKEKDKEVEKEKEKEVVVIPAEPERALCAFFHPPFPLLPSELSTDSLSPKQPSDVRLMLETRSEPRNEPPSETLFDSSSQINSTRKLNSFDMATIRCFTSLTSSSRLKRIVALRNSLFFSNTRNGR